MASNRFVCEICRKGFQRDQNLQLHRRGHNLPWKLRQRTGAEVRKKVYVCPEPTCMHHSPTRALGDLTGLKKHYCRKHGEKKWKCDNCSKQYAVLSDWKAHSKACRTKEYKCDCGTVFSRRENFITHRAFCDALAQDQENTEHTRPIMCTMASSFQGQGPEMAEPVNANTAIVGTPDIRCGRKSQQPNALFDSFPLSMLLSGTEGPMGLERFNSVIMGRQATSLAHTSVAGLLRKVAQVDATTSCISMDPPMIQRSWGNVMAGLDWVSGSSPCGLTEAHGPHDLLSSQGMMQQELVEINEARTADQFYGASSMNDMGGCSVAATVFTSGGSGYLKNAEHYGCGGAGGWGDGDVMTLDFLGVGEEKGF